VVSIDWSEVRLAVHAGGGAPASRRRHPGRRSATARVEALAAPAIPYYDLRVGSETLNGEPVSDEQIQVWADEAERGYPVDQLRKRGRRPAGDGPGEVVAVRMDGTLLSELSARAEREHVTRSEAIRAAVRAWIDAA
jgi:hypothetical protein